MGPRLRSALAVGLSTAVLLPATASAAMAPGPGSGAASGAASGTVPGTAAAAGHRKPKVIKVKVDPRMFGVHDMVRSSLTRAGTGSIRLWDSFTTWPDLQSGGPDTDFTRLDEIVRKAHANGTEVTLVLALTPAWAAASPDHTAPTDAPHLAAFKAFVTDVMTHYKNFFGKGKRGIANYQVWNEANISTFWTGTPTQMAQLLKTTWQVRNKVDPGARVIAPSMVARLGYEQTWIKKFYALKVGGKPVWKYADALSFSLYPLDTYPSGSKTRPGIPEDAIALLHTVQGLLAKDKVPSSIPKWDSEVNYGLRAGALGGTAASPISNGRQVAYVMRTYLLNVAAGLQRVYWYAYDMGLLASGGTLGNTLLTDPAHRTDGILTPAGKAFTRVQSWMRGTLVGTSSKRPCAADRRGTYTCVVQYAKGKGRIYWNPNRTVKVTLVKSAKKRVDEYGHAGSVRGGKRIKVGYAPVLVRSTH
ncbi:MAG: hypothetical protein WB797_06705 [Nocardioides sp.]